MDAGATDIVAGPGVGCWLDSLFGPLTRPIQPEMERVANSKRRKEASARVVWTADFARVAHSFGSRHHFFKQLFFTPAIVVCGAEGNYCTDGHLWDRGTHLPLATGAEGKMGRVGISLRGPPNLIHITRGQVYGTEAETSAELALSIPLESTDVTT